MSDTASPEGPWIGQGFRRLSIVVAGVTVIAAVLSVMGLLSGLRSPGSQMVEYRLGSSQVGLVAHMEAGTIGWFDGSADTDTDTDGDLDGDVVPVWAAANSEDAVVDFAVFDQRVVLVTERGDVVVRELAADEWDRGIRVWRAAPGSPRAIAADASADNVAFVVDTGQVFVQDLVSQQRQRVWLGESNPATSVAVVGGVVAWSVSNGNAFAVDLSVGQQPVRIWGRGGRTPAVQVAVTSSGSVGVRLANGNVRMAVGQVADSKLVWESDPQGPAVSIRGGDALIALLQDGSLYEISAGQSAVIAGPWSTVTADSLLTLSTSGSSVAVSDSSADLVRLIDGASRGQSRTARLPQHVVAVQVASSAGATP